MKYNKSKRIDSKTLLVTADCSKGKHMGYFRTPSGIDIQPFEFDNSRKGYASFWSKVTVFAQSHELSTILFGFESTGSYSACLADFMASQGAYLSQI
ncbi:MAG: hypothetical protein AAF519_20790, partial [Bacteroidota bacterium]